MNNRKVAILYGFCEGPNIGRKLEQALRAVDCVIVRKPELADVIVAHSGGCFVVPDVAAGKPIIFIGLPYMRHASMLKAYFQNIWRGFRAGSTGGNSLAGWVATSFWNLIYLWNLPYNWRIWRGMKKAAWERYRHVMLVHNTRDAISTPDYRHIPFTNPPKLLQLPGEHSDLWIHPETYVGLVQRLLA